MVEKKCLYCKHYKPSYTGGECEQLPKTLKLEVESMPVDYDWVCKDWEHGDEKLKIDITIGL